MLFSLRSRTAKAFKANFPYHAQQLCHLGCPDTDSQEHILLCDKVYPIKTKKSSIDKSYIFSVDSAKQADAVHLFSNLLERREEASSFTTGPSCCPVGDNNSSNVCSALLLGNKYIYYT